MGKALRLLRKHRLVDIILLAAILLVVAHEWFGPGLPRGSDAIAGLPPAAAAKDLLINYHIWSGWTTHWYLGYPIYYMYPSLAHVFLWVLSIPLGWTVSAKVLFLAFFVLSGVFAYLFVRDLTRNRAAGFVGALVYALAPCHLVEVIFEGHQGCFGMAIMLLPLVFWLTERALVKPSVIRILLGGIVLAVLILTHPQTITIVAGPFLALYIIFRIAMLYADGSGIRAPVVAAVMILLLGLLLTAFWWLPLPSETSNLWADKYSLWASRGFSLSFTEAITLSPSSGNAPLWSFAALPFGLAKFLRGLLVVLVLVGIILNRRNRYVWFCVALAVVTILLSMGLDAPVNLFGFAYDHIPFFGHIRTPGRFLMITSISYGILAGFGTKGLLDIFKQDGRRVLLVVCLCLAVTASAWQEAQDAFQPFQLTPDQTRMIDWIAEQDAGRVMPVPADIWIYPPQTKAIINPTVYTHLLQQDTVSGGAPNVAPKWTEAFLSWLWWETQVQPVNLDGTLDVIGVDYIVVDKTSPVSSNYVLDESCTLALDSDTLEVYRNQDAYPRIFALSAVPDQAFSEDTDWATVPAQLDEIHRDGTMSVVDFSLVHPGEYKVNFNCTGPCWIVLAESYYPGWVADVDGRKIESERFCGFLNAWRVEQAGEYDVTLEFTPSPAKRLGTVVSVVTLIGIIVFVLVWGLRGKLHRKPQMLSG